MDRYYFNIRRSGEVARDSEGDEFAGIDDARANAVNAVREIAAAQIKTGQAVADQYIDICNAAGELLASISFHDVVREQLKT